jgi:hypothetical protein
VILRQFLHTDPVIAASYIVGCGGQRVCAVVDPVDAPAAYMARDIPPPPPNAARIRATNLGLAAAGA